MNSTRIGKLFNVKKTYQRKRIYSDFLIVITLISDFCRSYECYKPTVEPLFPGVGRCVGVAVGFTVLVGIAAVPEFFTIVGVVVSVVPSPEVPPSLFAIIG